MFLRARLLLWFLGVSFLLLLSGCQGNGGGEPPTSTPLPAPSPTPSPITIKSVQVTPGEDVTVAGGSLLADATCIQTQLYADQMLQTWWPADQCGYVEQGEWEINVPLSTEVYSIELSPEVEYQVTARQEGKPEVASPIFVFDLSAPP